MQYTIKFRRGLEKDIPQLAEGEPGFTIDTNSLFVGSNNGNIKLANINDVIEQVATLNTKLTEELQNLTVELVEDRKGVIALNDELEHKLIQQLDELAYNTAIAINSVQLPEIDLSPYITYREVGNKLKGKANVNHEHPQYATKELVNKETDELKKEWNNFILDQKNQGEKANLNHKHKINDVTGLQDALDSAGAGYPKIKDVLVAGTNVTITPDDINEKLTISSSGGGGGSVSFGSVNEIPFTNATSDDFNYDTNFSYDGSALILNTIKGVASLALLSPDEATGIEVTDGGNIFVGNNTFNEGGEDVDLRIEGDTDVNLIYVDAGNNRVGIGINTPGQKLDVSGSFQATQIGVTGEYTLPLTDGTNGYVLSTNGTGTVSWIAQSGGSVQWGDITGTLSDQTDLQNALDDKYDADNPNGYTNNTGTVISIVAGTGLSGGTISTSGTIALDSATQASLALADSAVQDLSDLGITADATELNYVDGVTSAIQTQLDGKQPLDTDLTNIAALSTSGFISRNNTGPAMNARTITGTANEISVSNGTGTAGNPTLSLPTALTFTGKTITGGRTNNPQFNEAVNMTATSTELNILDGATLSTTELNYVDGVTSNIQTQLNSKLENITGLIDDGSNISITGTGTSGDPYVINASTGGFSWNEVTGTSQTAAINNGYIANNAGLVTVTLPSTAAVGSVVRVAGKGAGGWKLAQNSGQTIHFGTLNTTTGASGSITSTGRYDAIELVCITTNTDWVVVSSIGNLDVL